MPDENRVNEYEIKSIMAEIWQLDIDQIPSDAKFNEFSPWDSMSHVNLLVSLEQKYKITINFETLSSFTSIPSIMNFINQSHCD